MATEDIELSQYNSIGATLHQQLDPNALVIIGLTIVPELDCDLELMIIATGIQAPVACSAVQVDAATLPPPKDRFASLDLLNIHDLLNEKSGDSRNDLHYQSELDIPTYTRQKQLN